MIFFNKIKNWLLGNNNAGKNNEIVISAQDLVDQVFDHFKMRLRDSSTDMSLLFPTSFAI